MKTPFSNLKNKTGKHKDWYTPDFTQILCSLINPNNKYFDSKLFIKKFKIKHTQLELKDRIKLIAALLNDSLPGSYSEKLKILEATLGEPLLAEEGMFTYGFYLYPVSQFIELYGTDDLTASFDYIEQLTMRFTGEWAIRSLANFDEKLTLKKMKEWSKHENFHIRRLSSEGLRAKLPWGTSIKWINKNPEKSLPIYNKLRNDKVLYVRRSVANSMGDMIKLNEELVLDTFQNWLNKKQTKENLWVIKHAIRTPVKKKSPIFIKLKNEIEFLSNKQSKQ